MESGEPEDYFRWRRVRSSNAVSTQQYSTQLLEPLPPDMQRLSLNLSIAGLVLGALAVGLILGLMFSGKRK